MLLPKNNDLLSTKTSSPAFDLLTSFFIVMGPERSQICILPFVRGSIVGQIARWRVLHLWLTCLRTCDANRSRIREHTIHLFCDRDGEVRDVQGNAVHLWVIERLNIKGVFKHEPRGSKFAHLPRLTYHRYPLTFTRWVPTAKAGAGLPSETPAITERAATD